MSIAPRTTRPIEYFPSRGFFRNLPLGSKLGAAFGLMVLLALMVATLAYIGSASAANNIDRTTTTRAPTVLSASRAQADLLRMLASTRAYLALGEPQFRRDYLNDSRAFENDLANLEARLRSFPTDDADRQRLDQLQAAYAQWKAFGPSGRPLPDQLFDLRDDQLEREPAYRSLATNGVQYAAQLLIANRELINLQADQEPTKANTTLLREMAEFQSSFAAMLSGLRGYVTTRNRAFRSEYEANLDLNALAWSELLNRRAELNPAQQQLLNTMSERRDQFLALPDTMFNVLESDEWRTDLALFKSDAQRLGDQMITLLDQITENQQALLTADLAQGNAALATANQQTLVLGVLALALGVMLALAFTLSISGPVLRLTGVAERIEQGDLDARATINSYDEIGTLADTFNSMTGQLQQNLVRIRQEKKRADDLLNVVIPIGVSLTEERDFNRLLETMLVQAKSFCNARTGILYLLTAEGRLQYAIVRDDARGLQFGGTSGQAAPYPPLALPAAADLPQVRSVASYAALRGETVNIPTSHHPSEFDLSDAEGAAEQMVVQSLLAIALKNQAGQVLGVLELIDVHDEQGHTTPFDGNLQQMMESLSSLAVAALEGYVREQGLRQQIQRLHIEIDEAKRQKQVSEIVDSDFFQDLQAKARATRARNRRGSE